MGAHSSAPTPRAALVDYRSRVVSILTISGMVAVHAKRAVFTALAGVPGVTSAEVDLGRAVVEHEPSVSPDALREAVSLAGCAVTDVRMERRLPLSG
jgi:copper chaperone CopZ